MNDEGTTNDNGDHEITTLATTTIRNTNIRGRTYSKEQHQQVIMLVWLSWKVRRNRPWFSSGLPGLRNPNRATWYRSCRRQKTVCNRTWETLRPLRSRFRLESTWTDGIFSLHCIWFLVHWTNQPRPAECSDQSRKSSWESCSWESGPFRCVYLRSILFS